MRGGALWALVAGYGEHVGRSLRAAPQAPAVAVIVCNAVPDEAAIAVRQNDAGRLVSGLQYGTCASGRSPIREHDELALLSPTLGSWIFQVGELPLGLSHLVVVFEQHASGRPSFRSVALPEARGGSASVAIVDTARSASQTALRVEPAAKPAAKPRAQSAVS